MKTVKLLLLCLLALALLTSCAAGSPSVPSDESDPSEVPSPAEPSPDEPSVGEPSPEEPSPEEEIELPELTPTAYALDETILQNSLVSTGNSYRFARAFAKAARGEAVTVAAIGGSITEGFNASNRASNTYGAKLVTWMKEFFGNNKITLVNAGESGTPSKLGVMRVSKQVLDESPDIVLIEFAVNDSSDADSNTAYESLTRKILNSGTQPAVALLFTVTETGYSNQANMQKTGEHYGLPMVSVPDSIYLEVKEGRMLWDDYSDDDVHPSTEGHAMLGAMLGYCFEAVYNSARENPPEPYTVPEDTVFGDYYEDIVFVNQQDDTGAVVGSFTAETNDTKPLWAGGWKRVENSGNDPFMIEVTAKEVFLLYWATPGYGKPAGGVADVSVNGGEPVSVNSGTSWGSPLQQSLWKADTAEALNISVSMQPDSDANPFWILGFAYIP
ncbi:MAG: SGNH/GDSL hydrolase family protein [Oscillospiraceae bacterium]|jgi:lysophospholipase L1-like esterase|nr:SGNH/GDSL hydrolase family protein [Oscillospiraceae bacterium]